MQLLNMNMIIEIFSICIIVSLIPITNTKSDTKYR